MKLPNLFNFATKELSQDAFICWLLSWADKTYEKHDLHPCGLAFMQSILDKCELENQPVIKSIVIMRQYKNIDILCLLNVDLKDIKKDKPPENSYAIIIEDKVGSSQHTDQLVRYSDTIKKLNFEDKQILRIYLKTKDQANYKKIEADGYKPFTRTDFIAVLDSYKGTNHILIDFRTYWKKVEDETESHKELAITEWTNNAWRGFYKALNNVEVIGLNQGSWGMSSFSTSLAKPTYTGLFAQDKYECRLYVQLCKNTLNIKIKVKDESADKLSKKQLLNKWLLLVHMKDLENGLVLKRPKNPRPGKAMVIGTLENYIVSENNKVNLHNTIQNLRVIERFLSELEACQ